MKFERSWIDINLSYFEDNLTELKKHFAPKNNFMQIVKADAYGHGAFQIAQKAIENGAISLGVANAQEGALLRFQGIKIPILILSPSFENEIDTIFKNNLTPSVSTLEFARLLNEKGGCKIHLNIDTGMGRSGFQYRDAKKNITKIKKMKNLEIEGIFSHFSSAENDSKFTEIQIEKFQKILEFCTPKFVHIANSSGVVNSAISQTNLVRLGLLSFGIYADISQKNKLRLKQIMTFKSHISQIKTAEIGDTIGYNQTFVASQKMKFAILPVGYADGYDFMLSNSGKVLYKNTICDILGKISMDMIAFDISHFRDAKVGDEVTLLGEENKQIRADNLVKTFGGSSYELLSQIGRRAKRYFFENGKVIDSSPILRRDFSPNIFSENKLENIIETAIEQRLQSGEIANLVSKNFLQQLFFEKDKNIHYKKKFKHKITLSENSKYTDFYETKTELHFSKKLQNNYFYVACAKDEHDLSKYFLRNDVEYRWILDENFENSFEVVSVKIDNLELLTETKNVDGCIEVKCSHENLQKFVGKEVDFSILTKTYYPKKSHQLAVFINEMTHGIEITLESNLQNVEVIPIFSGKQKFPNIKKYNNKIVVTKNEWILPTSGVIFVY